MRNAHTRRYRLWAFLVFACPLAVIAPVALFGCGGVVDAVSPSVVTDTNAAQVSRDRAVLGTLLLACRPSGCTLSIDERVFGEVGPVASPVPMLAGEYRALLTAEGFLPVRERLVIQPGALTEWAVELWPEVDGVDNDR
ncbi:MAG: hypothetical protein ACI82G_002086 [Bradymonadia bacterium]|jgi:hypothetical protein